jgi:hypothetical protein
VWRFTQIKEWLKNNEELMNSFTENLVEEDEESVLYDGLDSMRYDHQTNTM